MPGHIRYMNAVAATKAFPCWNRCGVLGNIRKSRCRRSAQPDLTPLSRVKAAVPTEATLSPGKACFWAREPAWQRRKLLPRAKNRSASWMPTAAPDHPRCLRSRGKETAAGENSVHVGITSCFLGVIQGLWVQRNCPRISHALLRRILPCSLADLPPSRIVLGSNMFRFTYVGRPGSWRLSWGSPGKERDAKYPTTQGHLKRAASRGRPSVRVIRSHCTSRSNTNPNP